MRMHAVTLGVLMTVTLSGCGGDGGEPGPPVPLKSFVLHDVQGLEGGHALWVAEDNTAIVQEVVPPPPGKSTLQCDGAVLTGSGNSNTPIAVNQGKVTHKTNGINFDSKMKTKPDYPAAVEEVLDPTFTFDPKVLQ